jgi:hypothetical protein
VGGHGQRTYRCRREAEPAFPLSIRTSPSYSASRGATTVAAIFFCYPLGRFSGIKYAFFAGASVSRGVGSCSPPFHLVTLN